MLGIKKRLPGFLRNNFEELFDTSNKAAAVNAVSRVQLLLHYQDMAKLGLALPSIEDVGYRVYSQ
jgi:hypothetical protein